MCFYTSKSKLLCFILGIVESHESILFVESGCICTVLGRASCRRTITLKFAARTPKSGGTHAKHPENPVVGEDIANLTNQKRQNACKLTNFLDMLMTEDRHRAKMHTGVGLQHLQSCRETPTATRTHWLGSQGSKHGPQQKYNVGTEILSFQLFGKTNI